MTATIMTNAENKQYLELSPQPVFVLATQRSGTNYLRSLMKGTGLFADFNEVFHSEIDETIPASFEYFDWAKHSYFKYRAKRFAENPNLSIPLGEHVISLFSDYLDYLSSESGNLPYFLMDVKYSSLHHFDPVWHSLTARKFIFDLISSRGCRVVHLVRENVFNVYLSGQLAILTGMYVQKKDDVIELPRVSIAADDMLRELQRIEQEVNMVRLDLETLPNVYELTYESISSEGVGVPQSIEEELSEFFKSNIQLRKPATITRIIKDRWSVIENADEVIEALAHSPYAWCIE